MNYFLAHTTYPVVLISVFARQLCLPVPAVLFLIAGGALAGMGRISVEGILVVAVLGCLLADIVWFEAGRLYGKRVLKLLCALASDPSFCIRRARTTCGRYGLPVLLVAKFIPGLDGIAPPFAGMAGFSLVRFLLYDAGGSCLWSGAYLTVGFIFARELDKATRYISIASNVIAVGFGIPLIVLFIWKAVLLIRMIRMLGPMHIAPDVLKARLDAGDKIGIIDLQRLEDDPENLDGLPGAVRADPLELRRKRKVVIPSDVDLVLYCASENSFVSARAVAALRKKGVTRVWILNGGLGGWRASGLPLGKGFADLFEVMTRLGVKMLPPLRCSADTKPALPDGSSMNSV